MRPALLLALVVPLLLGGCLAKTALDVATAPVKIASKGVDLATTSQSEADENRGRALRQREARLGRLQRTYDRQSRACVEGNQGSCRQARETYTEIQAILPTVPAEPSR
jgi:hypothetical protein